MTTFKHIKAVDEFANAVSMFAFVPLSFLAIPLVYRIAITNLWVFAFMYHMALSMANENAAGVFLVGDIVSQIVNIIVLCNGTLCYSAYVKYPLIAMYTGGVMRILWIAIPYQTAMQRKESIRSINVATHVSHMCVAICCATNRMALCKSFWAMVGVGSSLFIHEMNVPFMWALGHIMGCYYVLYCWQALGIV